MRNRLQAQGPVVIGGVGGSGTRVVAKMLMDMGFYMGSDLNRAYDNLWFTFLFVRPKWFVNHARQDKELLFLGFDVLGKAMTGPFRLRPSEMGFIARTIVQVTFSGRRMLGRFRRLRGALTRVWSMIRSSRLHSSRHVGWGWKEPHSHFYINYLAEHWTNLRFIHVIRHGLDMAYSRNQRQLRKWGFVLGVDVPQAAELLPKAALEYWIKANRRAIALGERMGSERFLLVDFDKLCSLPQAETERIIDFVGLDAGKLDFDHLSSIPRTPSSVGRYKGHDLSIFDHENLDAVREFGFGIEA